MKKYNRVLIHQNDLLACFTTRLGGESLSPYGGFNLAFHVGDNPDHVRTHHETLAALLHYDRKQLVYMNQIHSDHVHILTDEDDFDHPPTCDALITHRLNTPLMVMSADCIPILVYDPVHRVIAAIHAGRAGVLSAIVPKTLRKMEEAYDTRPHELCITIGPSIQGCCYAINPTIAQEVKNLGYNTALKHKGGKIFLDLYTIVHHQLMTLGVVHIDLTQYHCSACHHETYFSYRADQQRTGRMAGVISLQPSVPTA
jgi:hypothetical protein